MCFITLFLFYLLFPPFPFLFSSPPSNSSLFFNMDKNFHPPRGGGMARIYISDDDYSFFSLALSDSRLITLYNSGSSQSKLFFSQCHGRPACCQVIISHQHKLRKKKLPTHFCKFRNSKHNYCKFRNSKHNYEAFITHTHITITIVYVCRYFRTKWAPTLEI